MHTRRGRRRILISRRRWEAMYQVEKITNNIFDRKRNGNNGGKRRGSDRKRIRGESTGIYRCRNRRFDKRISEER